MSIRDLAPKIKSWAESPNGRDFYIVAIIILVALASFGLGRLSKIDESKPPVRIIENSAFVNSALNLTDHPASGVGENVVNGNIEGQYVASKNGTKYHFPWCSGAQRIKEENKIWFETKEEAEKAGYGPAANCKGLK